jgi:hypothetical protein
MSPFAAVYDRHICSAKVATKWLAPLLRIREVPGSKVDPETGYSG